MKSARRLFVSCCIIFGSTVAMAQSMSTHIEQKNDEPIVYSTRGVRVAIVGSLLSAAANTHFSGERLESPKIGVDNTAGLMIGYANLPIQRAGFAASGGYMNIHERDSDKGV